jgi:small subunit ribosomal protein S20
VLRASLPLRADAGSPGGSAPGAGGGSSRIAPGSRLSPVGSRAPSLGSPPVANIASQEKRIQRSARERLENRRYTSAVKTYFRRLEEAVASGDEARAEAEHRTLISQIDRAVKRGALHRNTGARKKSRAAKLRAGSAG